MRVYSAYYAGVYLDAVDSVSISYVVLTTLYTVSCLCRCFCSIEPFGLILFYGLMKEELPETAFLP